MSSAISSHQVNANKDEAAAIWPGCESVDFDRARRLLLCEELFHPRPHELSDMKLERKIARSLSCVLKERALTKLSAKDFDNVQTDLDDNQVQAFNKYLRKLANGTVWQPPVTFVEEGDFIVPVCKEKGWVLTNCFSAPPQTVMFIPDSEQGTVRVGRDTKKQPGVTSIGMKTPTISREHLAFRNIHGVMACSVVGRNALRYQAPGQDGLKLIQRGDSFEWADNGLVKFGLPKKFDEQLQLQRFDNSTLHKFFPGKIRREAFKVLRTDTTNGEPFLLGYGNNRIRVLQNQARGGEEAASFESVGESEVGDDLFSILVTPIFSSERLCVDIILPESWEVRLTQPHNGKPKLDTHKFQFGTLHRWYLNQEIEIGHQSFQFRMKLEVRTPPGEAELATLRHRPESWTIDAEYVPSELLTPLPCVTKSKDSFESWYSSLSPVEREKFDQARKSLELKIIRWLYDPKGLPINTVASMLFATMTSNEKNCFRAYLEHWTSPPQQDEGQSPPGELDPFVSRLLNLCGELEDCEAPYLKRIYHLIRKSEKQALLDTDPDHEAQEDAHTSEKKSPNSLSIMASDKHSDHHAHAWSPQRIQQRLPWKPANQGSTEHAEREGDILAKGPGDIYVIEAVRESPPNSPSSSRLDSPAEVNYAPTSSKHVDTAEAAPTLLGVESLPSSAQRKESSAAPDSEPSQAENSAFDEEHQSGLKEDLKKNLDEDGDEDAGRDDGDGTKDVNGNKPRRRTRRSIAELAANTFGAQEQGTEAKEMEIEGAFEAGQMSHLKSDDTISNRRSSRLIRDPDEVKSEGGLEADSSSKPSDGDSQISVSDIKSEAGEESDSNDSILRRGNSVGARVGLEFQVDIPTCLKKPRPLNKITDHGKGSIGAWNKLLQMEPKPLDMDADDKEDTTLNWTEAEKYAFHVAMFEHLKDFTQIWRHVPLFKQSGKGPKDLIAYYYRRYKDTEDYRRWKTFVCDGTGQLPEGLFVEDLEGRPKDNIHLIHGLKDLIDQGLMTPGPNKLTVTYMGRTVRANLTSDGIIEYDDLTFESVSRFSLYVKRGQNPSLKVENGWLSVKYEGIRLAELRDKAIAKLTSPSGGTSRLHNNQSAQSPVPSKDGSGTSVRGGIRRTSVHSTASGPPIGTGRSGANGRGKAKSFQSRFGEWTGRASTGATTTRKPWSYGDQIFRRKMGRSHVIRMPGFFELQFDDDSGSDEDDPYDSAHANSMDGYSSGPTTPAEFNLSRVRDKSKVTLLMLIQSGLIKSGKRVLRIDYKGSTFFGDLEPDGTIIDCASGERFHAPSIWSINQKRLVNPNVRTDSGWYSIVYVPPPARSVVTTASSVVSRTSSSSTKRKRTRDSEAPEESPKSSKVPSMKRSRSSSDLENNIIDLDEEDDMDVESASETNEGSSEGEDSAEEGEEEEEEERDEGGKTEGDEVASRSGAVSERDQDHGTRSLSDSSSKGAEKEKLMDTDAEDDEDEDGDEDEDDDVDESKSTSGGTEKLFNLHLYRKALLTQSEDLRKVKLEEKYSITEQIKSLRKLKQEPFDPSIEAHQYAYAELLQVPSPDHDGVSAGASPTSGRQGKQRTPRRGKPTRHYCMCQIGQSDPPGWKGGDTWFLQCTKATGACRGWVHPSCFGLDLREKDAESLKEFVCPLCSADGVELKLYETDRQLRDKAVVYPPGTVVMTRLDFPANQPLGWFEGKIVEVDLQNHPDAPYKVTFAFDTTVSHWTALGPNDSTHMLAADWVRSDCYAAQDLAWRRAVRKAGKHSNV